MFHVKFILWLELFLQLEKLSLGDIDSNGLLRFFRFGDVIRGILSHGIGDISSWWRRKLLTGVENRVVLFFPFNRPLNGTVDRRRNFNEVISWPLVSYSFRDMWFDYFEHLNSRFITLTRLKGDKSFSWFIGCSLLALLCR